MKKRILFLIVALLIVGLPGLLAQHSQEVILKVQTRLAAEGFDPGAKDGLMGPQTAAALELYQREHGLRVSGQIDDATLENLGIKDRGLVSSSAGAVGSGAATAGKATAKGATAAGKATATGATTAGKATAKGATAAGKATATGATTAGKATATGATTAGKATARGATTAGKATARGATSAAGTAADVGKATGRAVAGGASKIGGIFTGSGEDRELVNMVQEALEKSARIDASKIEVSSEGDGVIRLTFKSDDQNQWNMAVAKTRSVKGVKQVFVRLPGDSS